MILRVEGGDDDDDDVLTMIMIILMLRQRWDRDDMIATMTSISYHYLDCVDAFDDDNNNYPSYISSCQVTKELHESRSS